MGDVKKVAILGGGVGAMTAAWWLSQKSDPATTEYEITVYQLGWRLGGKGASGRNMTEGYGHRIEEHGLHIWMGFYANAFRMMKDVYEQLGRPESAPLSTLEKAFEPLNTVCLMSNTMLGWHQWMNYFPENDGKIGHIPQFRLPCELMKLIPPVLRPFVNELLEALSNLIDPAITPGTTLDIPGATAKVLALKAKLEELHAAALVADAEGDHHHHVVRKKAGEAHDLLAELFESIGLVDEVLRWLYVIDLGLAILRGIIDDDICENGWTSINDTEWRAWLLQNGLHQQTSWCPYVRAFYDLAFAYRDGIPDQGHADLSAGWATVGVLRMVFEYQGHMFWKMQAGMGDAVFAPFYEVLSKKPYNVNFKFFHRVREVVPSADGQSIASVRIGVQATPKDGTYDPLFTVNDLPCWPATPLYEQLVEGEQLKDWNIDLEAYDAPWRDVADVTLEAGVDFDWVVFGLAVGAVPYVCPQIVAGNPQWQAMVENVVTVRTQAFQLWLNQDIQQLGWPPALDGSDHGERALVGSFVEPLDTWADMSQLIPRETWPPGLVKNIAYFCGPAAKDNLVAPRALQFLRFDQHWNWPNAYDNLGEFKWEYLVDPNDVTGVGRLASQYFRYNRQPTELYVLSCAGTTQYRIGQDTGYSNLCIVGDWTNNGFAMGCVEGAVIGGMYGIEPITGPLPIVK